MADLDNQLKSLVTNYLQGEPLSDIQHELTKLCKTHKKNGEALFKAVKLTTPLEDPYLIAICAALGIPLDSRKLRHHLQKSKDLHQLLVHLYHDGHYHLRYLLKLIQKAKPPRTWAPWFILGAIGSVIVGLFIYFKQEYLDKVIHWFSKQGSNHSASLLRYLNIIGLIHSGISLIYAWYTSLRHGTSISSHKRDNLIYLTLTSSLDMAAYALTYASGGALLLPAAALFITSSLIDVVQALYTRFKSKHILDELRAKRQAQTDSGTWVEQAQYARQESLHQRLYQTFWVNFATTIAVAAVIAIWCLCPLNLPVVACCITFLLMISWAKQSFQKWETRRYAEQLQENLKKITAEKPEALSPKRNIQTLDDQYLVEGEPPIVPEPVPSPNSRTASVNLSKVSNPNTFFPPANDSETSTADIPAIDASGTSACQVDENCDGTNLAC